MDKSSLQTALATSSLVRGIYYFPELDSTSTFARELVLKAGTPGLNGTLVVASHQTGGKGRLGRTWESPANKALLFTIILHSSYLNPTGNNDGSFRKQFSAAFPIAVCEGIRSVLPNAFLKFPNDIVVHDRKIGGILLEEFNSPFNETFYCCGIGVNCDQTLSDFPNNVRTPPSSIFLETGKQVDKSLLLRFICDSIETMFKNFDSQSIPLAFTRYCSTLGREIILDSNSYTYSGIAKNVDENGALVIQTDAGEMKFHSSQVKKLTVL